MTNRLFIAVEMSSEVQKKVAELVEEFSRWDRNLRNMVTFLPLPILPAKDYTPNFHLIRDHIETLENEGHILDIIIDIHSGLALSPKYKPKQFKTQFWYSPNHTDHGIVITTGENAKRLTKGLVLKDTFKENSDIKEYLIRYYNPQDPDPELKKLFDHYANEEEERREVFHILGDYFSKFVTLEFYFDLGSKYWKLEMEYDDQVDFLEAYAEKISKNNRMRKTEFFIAIRDIKKLLLVYAKYFRRIHPNRRLSRAGKRR